MNLVVKRGTRAFVALPYNPALKERAKQLRQAGNWSEVLLWQRLKGRQVNGLDFDRQKIIGNYIVDFFCASHAVVIEVDGSSHDAKALYDTKRDAYLRGLGLRVLHIADWEVKNHLEGVMTYLQTQLFSE